jgi:hypothetical protein
MRRRAPASASLGRYTSEEELVEAIALINAAAVRQLSLAA